jgi:hypothetical protein
MCDIATNLRLKRETEELFVTKNRKEKKYSSSIGTETEREIEMH